MAGVLLETMSKKQIIIFTLTALLSLAIFFILGGTKVSDPANARLHIATACNSTGYSWKNAWHRREYYSNEKLISDGNAPCHEVKIGEEVNKGGLDMSNVVFSVHMPHPGDEFDPYEQFIVVSMNVEIEKKFASVSQLEGTRTAGCTMYYKAKVGYREKETERWKKYRETEKEMRPLQCVLTTYQSIVNSKEVEGYYTCEDMHFLEIGSIQHKYYLINMQLTSETGCGSLGLLKGLHFVQISQKRSYTWAWFIAKTVMTPFLIAALIFFFRRTRSQPRPPILLEKLTGGLGISLLFLICLGLACCHLTVLSYAATQIQSNTRNLDLLPIEWLTLSFEMPFMLLFSDLRQGQFYAFLLSFWCIFAGEHILDQQKRGTWKCYKWQLSSVTLGCLALLIFDLIERGVQLHNPFHTIWKKDRGETIAKGFIVVAAACSILFVLFFFGLVFNVLRHMRIKGRALPVMQESRRLFYQGVIYRFRVLVGITLFSAVITVLCFVLDQVNEGHWKFIEDNPVNAVVRLSSALHFGTFGLWNIYVISILILYSPNATDEATSVRYRAGREGQGDALAMDESEESIELQEGSGSVVYQLAGQHIKE